MDKYKIIRICFLNYWILFIYIFNLINPSDGCEFYPIGEYLRFVRIPENFPIGDKVLSVEVHNRQNLSIESVEKSEDNKYFKLSNVKGNKVDIILIKSLENIIGDPEKIQNNILKFRLVCFPEDPETAPNFLSISIFVEDINNHRPKFLHAPYHVTVDELTPVGLTVFRGISGVDLDKANTPNSDINYSIVDGNKDGKFGLESSHRPGLIVKKSLDYDSGDREFQLVISASDRGSPPLSSNATVFVTVKDNDDLPVVFKKPVYSTQIKEFFPITNETIRQEMKFPSPILAYDQDLSLNVSVEYDIVSGNELGYFEMDPKTGRLYLVQQLDREALPSDTFELQIRARQTDNPTKFGLSKVIVQVLDLNENLPQFEQSSYNISIMENLPNGFSVLQVYASDKDQGENAEFIYKLEDKTKAFTIDPKSGWLTVRDETKLDREKVESIELKIVTEEKVPNVAHNGKKSHTIVTIGLLDANDNSPVFTPSNLFHFQVTIDSEIGSVVGQVTAEDADVESTGNGKIVYEIQKSNGTSPQDEMPFEIDSKNGYIFLLERPLPKLHYTILVEASDLPSNPSERRFSLAVVQIDVVKGSVAHVPEFVGSPYEFWVGTQVGIGTSVGQVKVKDLDSKHTVYDLLHSYYEGVPFAIEERTGIIAVVDDLVKYPRHHYEFEAYVTDSRHTLTSNVSIHVVDPVEVVAASAREPLHLQVKENVGGAVLGNLKVLLGDTGSMMGKETEFLLASYELRDKFAISNDGTIYTLKGLDREERESYLLTVISQSRGLIQGQGVYQINVQVMDENDSKPKFDRLSYEGHVRENSSPGTPILMESPISVSDADLGSNAMVTLELKGSGSNRFRIDPTNGKLYVGNIPLDREERQFYSLEIVGTDGGNLSSSVPLRISIDDINDNAPTFENNIVLDPPDLDSSLGARELLRASASQPVAVEISSSEPIRIPETIEVGTKIARVLASDKDLSENAIIFYRIVSENSNSIGEKFSYLTDKQYLFSRNKEKHFSIDRSSGEISVSKSLKPDTEYALNISASDRGGLRSYTGLKIIVFDVNNFQPVFSKTWYSFEIDEGSYASPKLIGKISASDGDSGLNGLISYKLLTPFSKKSPFKINSTTGEIFVEGELDREKNSKYSLIGAATDSGTPPLEGTVEIQIDVLDINDNSPIFYDYMTLQNNFTPIYRTSLDDNVPIGTQVIQIQANDSDSIGNGNGLVLLHLNNHHREFYIDSKTGIISTVSKLNIEPYEREYNLSVIGSDLGKPSLSSTAWVLVRILESNETKEPQVRMFSREIYAYNLEHDLKLPYLLTKMNVSEKYEKESNEFELVGDPNTIRLFRIQSDSGEIFITNSLEPTILYEFIVRGNNGKISKKGFDTRQGKISDTYLALNEALVRVRRNEKLVPIILSTTLPPIKKLHKNKELRSDAAEPAIITKAPPRVTKNRPNESSPKHGGPINIFSYEKNANLYAGEIAVLVLSAVIFLGGVVAAIAVLCVRKKRRVRRRRATHFPPLPVEVRLQKGGRIGGPARPILFPMALPSEPIGEIGSENTSDTYTESGELMREKESFALQNAGFSICPDCRKLRKPGGRSRVEREVEGGRDRGPLKQMRPFGPREVSMQSNHDSGIDGPDGHCNCCQNHFSSSESARSLYLEQFEDSLMPHQLRQSTHQHQPKSFRRKRSAQTRQFNIKTTSDNVASNSNNLSSNPNINFKNIRSDRMVML